ncbi:MAG: SCO family protein [Holophagales bacterium]|nr:MAG: SCO family protein [Holophagales bacterium]
MSDGRSALRIAVWALLALAVPVLALLAWKESARRAVPPPPVLGVVPDFAFVERDGGTVRRADLAGRPWVADFIFTRCVLSCPRLTAQMKQFRTRLPESVRSVSISVDPEFDTPEVLLEYAGRYQIYGRDWLFLTGRRDDVLSLIRDGFKVSASLPEPGQIVDPREPILHSTRFVLVDGANRIRGYYDGFDEEALAKLLGDLSLVLDEKVPAGERR